MQVIFYGPSVCKVGANLGTSPDSEDHAPPVETPPQTGRPYLLTFYVIIYNFDSHQVPTNHHYFD